MTFGDREQGRCKAGADTCQAQSRSSSSHRIRRRLIQAWRSRTQGKIFNDGAPMTVRHFIDPASRCASGTTLRSPTKPASACRRLPLFAPVLDPTQSSVPINNQADDTRLALPVPWTNLGSVIRSPMRRSLQHRARSGAAGGLCGELVGLGRSWIRTRIPPHADHPESLHEYRSGKRASRPNSNGTGGLPVRALSHARLSSRSARSRDYAGASCTSSKNRRSSRACNRAHCTASQRCWQ